MSKLTACHECDLLILKHDTAAAFQRVCPRCGAVISEPKPDSLNKTLALVTAGLILYLPANFLPILKLDIMGNYSSHTMFSAVVSIYQGGLEAVALMVLFCSMLAPLIRLFLLFVVIVLVQNDRGIKILPRLLRGYIHLDSWAMLEVYMLALLVSVIKLMDMAQIHAGVGMSCFIGLMLACICSKLTIDKAEIWKMIEHRQRHLFQKPVREKGRY